MPLSISDAEKRSSISERLHVLGRGNECILNIGRYYAIDGSLGSEVYIDGSKPHVILICGKRGYGKSYTMGVIMEELYRMDNPVKKNLGVVVIDTLGIYWTSFFENRKQKNVLERWGLSPSRMKITLLSSAGNMEKYRKIGLPASKFAIKASELSAYQWCHLFGVKMVEPLGVAISRAINELEGKNYSLEEVVECIRNDGSSSDHVKGACENFFRMASSWNLFDTEGMAIEDIVRAGEITVIDMSSFSDELKKVLVSIMAGKIFERRVIERKEDEEKIIKGRAGEKKKFPLVWMAIDEAQLFLPREKSISKDILINQWMRQGRQPGLSLILATQRPGALDGEVMSHSDIIICHRLTSQEDIDALNRVRPTYMKEEMGEALKKVGSEKGVALIVDDISESVRIIKVRPRLSWHGGEEACLTAK
ncbi:MAG: ATP-binding protein [Thermoplasmata archaeon]|nr:MAG: ATP-binding protein [Thermoplasmata archaeon]